MRWPGPLSWLRRVTLSMSPPTAQISYPVVRVASPPDWQYHEPLLGLRHAMEAMLTGDVIDGVEAARVGWANRAYPAAELEAAVLAIAERVAAIPTDLAQLHKRMFTASSTSLVGVPRCVPARNFRPSPLIKGRYKPSSQTRLGRSNESFQAEPTQRVIGFQDLLDYLVAFQAGVCECLLRRISPIHISPFVNPVVKGGHMAGDMLVMSKSQMEQLAGNFARQQQAVQDVIRAIQSDSKAPPGKATVPTVFISFGTPSFVRT